MQVDAHVCLVSSVPEIQGISSLCFQCKRHFSGTSGALTVSSGWFAGRCGGVVGHRQSKAHLEVLGGWNLAATGTELVAFGRQ